jgi:copper chaperone CopZ
MSTRRILKVRYASAIAVAAASSTGVYSFAIVTSQHSTVPTPTLFREQQTGSTVLEQWRRTEVTGRDSFMALRGGSAPTSDAEGMPTETQGAAVVSSNERSDAYYLVWSPGFVKTLALTTALLAVVRNVGLDHKLFSMFAGGLRFLPSGLVPNLLLPLLSSSCCAIQLAVNAISVAAMGAGAGCLGFNTYLGPLRPYLLAVMVAYHTVPTSPTTVLRYAIALMPEAVAGWNDVLRARWRRRNSNAVDDSSSSSASPTIQATLVVEVPTMGCVACVNKIESSLRSRAPGYIETASSWLNPKPKVEGGKKGGRAKIEVRATSKDELDDITRSLVGAIEDAGFGGSTIESLDIRTTTTTTSGSKSDE